MAADVLGDDDEDLIAAVDGVRLGGYKGRRERAQRAERAPAHGPSGELGHKQGAHVSQHQLPQ